MKIKLFDNITVTAEPEEVYMLLWIHNKMSKPAPAPVIAPETPESASPSMVDKAVPVVAAETLEANPEEVVAALMRADAVDPKKKRVSVDWGKAKALRKAGWSLSKIADELGVSVPTVSQHLKEVK